MKNSTLLTRWLTPALTFLGLTLMTSAVQAMDMRDNNCIMCHQKQNPGLVKQYMESAHGKKGVGCLSCHEAKPGEPDALAHNGGLISIVPTPKDCSSCHQKEFDEQRRSHHARAGEILASLDNLLGEVVGGPAAVNAGCRQCHGSEVKFENGQPTPETWPNTGMGRINADGSKGSCTACHTRHEFSKAQARQPENCGKCHLGPDHPQIEVYNESKHGILYHANREKMNLEDKNWVAGMDYYSSATCSTCHMSRAPGVDATHDVGDRISWTLRPPVSMKLNMVIADNGLADDVKGENPELPQIGDTVDMAHAKGKVVDVKPWQQRRATMQQVCRACHTPATIKGFYQQFDDVVHLYNDKFAKPAKAIMKELKDGGYLKDGPFNDAIEWTWWEIWHHEGRRARHGASMMAPDYTWWHGLYEVAKHFYFHFIPELREAVHVKDGNEDFAEKLLDKYVRPIDGHKWYFEGMSKDRIDEVRRGFEQRYGKGSLQ